MTIPLSSRKNAMGTSLWMTVGLSIALASPNAWADCVDYREYVDPVIGSVDTPGSARTVALAGTVAYVADGGSGLQVIDVSNPASPLILGSVDTPGTANGVAVSGSRVYVADGDSGLVVISIANPEFPVVLGRVSFPAIGYALDVAVSGTLAYVADGSDLRVVDVTHPASPALLGSVPTPGGAHAVAVSGAAAYVADGLAGIGHFGMAVIDVSNPAAPQYRGSVSTSGYPRDIVVSGTMAYLADTDWGLTLIDISPPFAPQVIGGVATPGFSGNLAVYGTLAYLADGGTLQVIDVSNPGSPLVVGTLDATTSQGLAATGTLVYATNGQSGLQIIDVSNPGPPAFLGGGLHDLQSEADAVAVSGTIAYVSSGGLKVIDVSNPASPVVMGNLAGAGGSGMTISGTRLYSAGGDLRIINLSNPVSPVIEGTAVTPGTARDVAVSGAFAYVADQDAGLQVVNISNPAAPVVVGNVNTPGLAYGVAVSGTMAYVADAYGGLHLIDVSTPTSPNIVGSAPVAGDDVVVSGGLAYVSGAGLQVVGVWNPASPVVLGGVGNPLSGGSPWSEIAVVGRTVFVADGGLAVFDVSDPASPVLMASLSLTSTGAEGLAVSGEAVYVAHGGYAGYGDFMISPSQCPSQEVVDVGASGFVPGNVTVLPDGQVTWVRLAGIHTTTNGTGPLDPKAGSLWDAVLQSNAPQFVHVFTQSGDFPYFCRNHPSETGTIHVSGTIGIDDNVSSRIPVSASPNPFLDEVDIQFALDRDEDVSLVILDLQGRQVRYLAKTALHAGTHRLVWDGMDEQQRPVGAGFYFARLMTGGGNVQAQKLFKIR